MKKTIHVIAVVLVIFSAAFLSSCQEENVQPAHKDGNITGQDDWVK
jgi:predicted small secreted protein